MSMSAIAARAAALLLTSEKGRKGVGFLLVAIFAPVILIAAILCSATSGGADHNNSAVEASFYGVTYSEDVPDEFRTHIADMQTAFSFLDSAVAEANATMTDGNRLDPIQVKAIFYALCFGESAPSQRAADRFVDCFFITEQRTRIVVTELEDGSTVETEEVYTATVPLSLAAAYENLAAKLGRAVTDEDKENAAHIYTMIAGNANGSDGTGASGGTIQIDYGYGSGSTELDTSGFTNPAGKNADDLVQYAIHAYEEQRGIRDSIKGTAMNLIKGFMAVSLFSVVPVKLYELCVSLQANFGYAISGAGESFGTVAGNIIDELTVENFVDFATTHVGGFGSVTSPIMVLFLSLIHI